MKTALFPAMAVALLFATACDRPSPPPPNPQTQTPPKTQTPQPRETSERINISEYEADRLRQQNNDLRQRLEQTTAPVNVTREEQSRVDQENAALKREIEALQNQVVREAAEKEKQKQLAENKALKAKLAQLEKQLRDVSQTQTLIKKTQQPKPTKPIPSVLQYSTVPPKVSDISYFFQPLSSLGSWIQSRDYGYVWSPPTGRNANWHPYGNGRWAKTEFGWTWVSNEKHGWATNHYGRWTQHPGLGWLWVPGTVWSPAWVSWRVGNNHAGWAPLPPESMRSNRFEPDLENRYPLPPQRYLFTGLNHLLRSDVQKYRIPLNQNNNVIRYTSNVTQIQGNDSSYVHHRGLDRFASMLRLTPPNYNLRFDSLHERQVSRCGTKAPNTATGKMVISLVKPGFAAPRTPVNYTQVNSPLYNQMPIPKAPPRQPAQDRPAQPRPGNDGKIKIEDIAKDLLQGWLEKKINDQWQQ